MPRDVPQVSVIIPAYNCAKWLADAIGSVLNQAHRPLEIIVVDDGSIDDTAFVAKSFGDEVDYHYQSNQGPAAARNAGLDMAAGSIIGFLDADDQWTGDKLEVQLPRLLHNPNLDIVLGQTQVLLLRQGGRRSEAFRAPWHATSFGAGLFRSCVFNHVGRLDPALRSCEDLEWFLRARDCQASIEFLSHVSQFYRWHLTNQCRTTGFASTDFFQVIGHRIKRKQPLPGTRMARWGCGGVGNHSNEPTKGIA